MFDRILVPLDGSAVAESTLPWVTRILRRSDAEVVLLRVVVPEIPEVDALTPQEKLTQDADAYLGSLIRRVESEGVRVRGIVRVGSAPEEILDVSRSEKASLIAMSTHGRSGVSRWIFGSVAEKVLRSSLLPVLVVRSFGPERAGIRTILVPTDGSSLSMGVLPAVKGLARLFGSRVLFLHVLEQAGSSPMRDVETAMTRAVQECADTGVQATTTMRIGDPAVQVLDACESSDIDLIAMSTHGRSGVSRWVFGSVTEKILRAVFVPMLVVRG